MSTGLSILLVILLTGSGFILKHVIQFKNREFNYTLPFYFGLAGILAATQLRDLHEAMIFLLASIGQFIAYVFVSRLRQRGSFTWHAIAGLGSNGMWYMVMHILKMSETYWMLFILYIVGILAGRTVGVIWAQFVEDRFNLEADATRDNRLEPGKRLDLIKKEPAFWILLSSLLAYLVYGHFNFDKEMYLSLYIVVGLGVLQSFFYALNTRASQRGHNWYIALTGLMAGITFYINAVFLFSKGMHLSLSVPYVLSTTLGSTTGALMSMIIEWTLKLRPDTHLDNKSPVMADNPPSKKLPYMVLLALATIWILFQAPIFDVLGIPLAELKFPISAIGSEIPRVVIILSAALIFMLDSALHTIASRAGNRNHTGYHVAALLPKGLVDFLKISYISLNDTIPDIVPVGVMSGCLGSLYGKDVSQKLERWLQARMDLPTPEPQAAKS